MSHNIDVDMYRKVNDSFSKKLVFHVGIDCGLFVELNHMVNAILYCLSHHIKFVLYSDDANFSTGKGWTEYFSPFCEEVHDSVHHQYNFHRLPSWKRIFLKRSLRFLAWKLKSIVKTVIGHFLAYRTYGEYVLLTQDVPDPDIYYQIPELGISGEYMEVYGDIARMIWHFQPHVETKTNQMLQDLDLPNNYSAVHIRGGDKQNEAVLVDGSRIVKQLNPDAGDCVFVLTDDYRLLEEVSNDFVDLHFKSLCKPSERGYVHQSFVQSTAEEKIEAIVRLLLSMNILLNSQSFVGSITTGLSVFVMKLRVYDPHVRAIDCPMSMLKTVLTYPIDRRAKLSRKVLTQSSTDSGDILYP